MAQHFYARQKALLGEDAQEKLAGSRVAIIGLGGLGSTVAHLLSRMGVGTLILVDDDVVADHNLARQHLYTVADIGRPKVAAAKKHLQAISKDVVIQTHEVYADKHLLSTLSVDMLLDCVDNHATRRIITAYCKEHKLPWIHGAAIAKQGTVCFFHPEAKYDYETIYAGKTQDQQCSITGVLGTIITVIGTLQTQLAIDYLTTGSWPKKLFRIDLENLSMQRINL